VASVQTLIRRLGQVDPFDLIIVDEAHHLIAENMWAKVIERFPSAKLMGLTATPERLDGRGLGIASDGYFETMIEGPKVKDLIDRGYLSKYKLFAPPVNIDLEGMKTQMGDYSKSELNERVNKNTITGDAVEHYRKLCPNAKGIVFCVSVEHSKKVAKEFCDKGIIAAHLDGGTKKNKRKEILTDFKSGKIQVLTNVSLFTEGFDVPGIQTVQILRPTQSTGLWRQMIGRALRPNPGKTHALILDHVSGSKTHGLPDDEYEWSLEGTRKKGKKRQMQMKFKIRTCPDCFGTHALTYSCPYCGHQYEKTPREIEIEQGELKELSESEKNIIRRQKRFQEAKAQTLEDFQAIAKERGYKPSWAKLRYNLRMKRHAKRS
jgi:superfamily II DNA or RNA helicase